jgi:oxygen-independent coproporphyrinogen-3 oxidase
LNFLGRNHTKKRAIQAIHDAKEVGFKHINLDIIYGCELDTIENMKEDIFIAKELPIDHISAYSLTIEEETKFYNTPKVKIDDYELSLNIFDELKDIGFNQYEISNFSKSDESISKHNLGYWQYKEYVGCGSGAIGRVGYQRYYKNRSVEEYIQDPISYIEIEELSQNDIIVEKVLLGLRSIVGIELALLDKNKVNILVEEKKLYIKDDRVFLNDYLIADEVALYLLDDI